MNYVFFFPDELRADALHTYGNRWTSTPNFDLLAQQGTRFEQCHVQNTVCAPSRCCLFTGRYPHSDGHRTLWNLVKPYERNLFSYLKENGYDVYIYGKNDVLSQEAINVCTDEFLTMPGKLNKPTQPVCSENQKGYQNFLYEPCNGKQGDLSDDRNVEKGLEFLRSRKKEDAPFFLFLPLLLPHCPYTVPEPYYSMYQNSIEQIELRPKGLHKPKYQELIRKYRNLDMADMKKIRAVYSGMVSYSDALLGQVMNCLKETGLDKTTTLIAASDHGDYAGDYGLVEKWPNAFEDNLTRVPLIVSGPGVATGHIVSELVELFDIMPTILELSNIKPKHFYYAKSLVAQLRGASGDPNRVVFAEGGYNPEELQCTEGVDKPSTRWMQNTTNPYYPKYLQQKEHPESVDRAVMIRTCDYKYIKRSYGDNELYDLKADSEEINNIVSDPNYQPIVMDLEQRILKWYLDTADAVPMEEDARDNKPKYKKN